MIIVLVTIKRARVKDLAKVIQIDRDVRPFAKSLGNGRENRGERGKDNHEKKEIDESESADTGAFGRGRLHAIQAILRVQRKIGNRSSALAQLIAAPQTAAAFHHAPAGKAPYYWTVLSPAFGFTST